jgi:hypothetical protein
MLFGALSPHMIICRRLQSVEGASDAERSAIQHVSVNHRCSNIAVTPQFLNGSDVLSGFEKMRRKAMPHRMRGGRF